MTHLRGFPRDWDPCEIAVSIDARGGDRRGKTFLSQDHYFEALQECDFVLSPPGWCMPVSHNLIESMFCGAIPITNGGAFMAEPLADDVNCLAFEDEEGLVAVIECALAMNAGEVARVREAVRDYYERFLDSKAFGERFIRTNSTRIFVNAEENSVPLVFPGMVFPWAVPADTMQT
jgi:glycosyltransferase involved in cell wall biosynthesis